MKKLIVCLAVLMMAMMLGGTVWAWNSTDHVKVAPNGKGDLLIYPWYFAMPGGYDTKISVINTSSAYSVVAKVVYRSYAWSVEVLDHLIFLSPNDVWTGRLTTRNGVAVLVCTDDSMLGRYVSGSATADDFADKTPVSQPLAATYCTGDSNQFGYIEVIEAAAIPITDTKVPISGGKAAKKDIYNWYAALTTVADYPPVNVLTGYQENFVGLGQTLKQAAVYADYDNTLKLSIGVQTRLGQNANNTLAELEAAMGKFDVALPYVSKSNGDMTLHIFNFPTKLSLENSASCNAYHYYYESPYWTSVYYQCESYTRNIYDLMENTPQGSGSIFSPIAPGSVLSMCEEVHLNYVNYSAAAAAYTEGWIRYNWGQSKNLKYGTEKSGLQISFTGTPVLPSALFWTDSGANWAEAVGAFTDGTVYEGRTLLNYYQYSD